MEALLKLRRLMEPPPPKSEKCELCGAVISPGHSHVVDIERHRLLCACRPCSLLFANSAAAGGKLRSVPRRYRNVPNVDLAAENIPAGAAFFIRDSTANRLRVFYPSPAGATESEISPETFLNARPFALPEPDVEALLVTGRAAWIVPVDVCYELIGRIRQSWRGFAGGRDALRRIDDFLDRLKETEPA
ncbi:MAG TPA: DUF5947 family protein [Bryobacteraceae bacterium]|jgi:hypothetical protein|nr:DUF5947 family protein [Bryobacteraceae bacterium]